MAHQEKPLVVLVFSLPTDLSDDEAMKTIISTDYMKVLSEDVRVIPFAEAAVNPNIAKEVVGMYLIGGHSTPPNYDLFPNLRIVSNIGAGVDAMDVPQLKKRGIMATNTPTAVADATADIAVGLLIATARRFRSGLLHALNLAPTKVYDLGFDVHAKTVGIVGLGGIGSVVAKRLQGFDMRILYHQRHRRPNDDEYKATFCPVLDDMLPDCDFVIIAVPLSNETRHMFNKERFEKMKSTAIIINVARGGIVDTEALTRALEEGRLGGAGLDVTDPEPLPAGHPLLHRADVFIVPHIGTGAVETRRKMLNTMVANLKAGLAGQTPPNIL